MKPKTITLEIYRDVDKQWRLRFLRRAFGQTFIVSDGGEGYRNKKDLLDMVGAMRRSFEAGQVKLVVTP